MVDNNLLEKLIHPISTQDFVSRLATAPRIFKGNGIDLLDLLSIGDIDRLITVTGLRPPFISLFNGLSGVDSADYNLYFDGSVHCANPARLLNECLKRGTTLIIQHIHRLHPTIAALATHLAKALHPISLQTNCYFTPQNSQGVFPHADQHHTLLLQLEGKKRWCVWANDSADRIKQKSAGKPASQNPQEVSSRSKPVLDAWVGPGDLILIPSGFVHTPFTGNTHSLHLTFGLTDPKLKTAAEQIFRGALNEGVIHSLNNHNMLDNMEDDAVQSMPFVATDQVVAVI